MTGIEWDRMGKPVRLLGTTFDITEIKKAEESLRLYENIVNASTDAMAIIEKQFGKEGTTHNWNTILKIGGF